MNHFTKKDILVFDFDGTIADTFHHIIEISNLLSKEFNFNAIHPNDVERLKDMTSQEVTRYLGVPLLKVPLIVAKGRWQLHKSMDSVKPTEGLRELVHALKSLGYEIGILTSNSLKNVVTFLKNHDLDVFDFIRASSKVWEKSHGLDALMKDKGMDPREVIYVGDETRDIEAAQKAGIRVAAVSWGYNSSKALLAHKPDYLIHKPEELLKVCSGSVNPAGDKP
ncbi:MAG TPA: carotenoid oxygenase [Candidatus Omnitrophica bacterium]|nr:MAG: hypothetical protein A2Z81_06270 [Omnitrophica WOR_2 bacterium GWA2_45_18]HBR15822.1 carotenoid oxygenase [Candidatus Omnitrophota bacterium]